MRLGKRPASAVRMALAPAAAIGMLAVVVLCSGCTSDAEAQQATLAAQRAQAKAERAEEAANKARIAAEQAQVAAERAQKAVADATREINRVSDHLDQMNRQAAAGN